MVRYWKRKGTAHRKKCTNDGSLHSFEDMQKCIRSLKLPTNWYQVVEDGKLVFAMLEISSDNIALTKFSLAVQDDLTWRLHRGNKPVALQNNDRFPQKLDSSTALLELMRSVSTSRACEANKDKSWHILNGWKAKKFLNRTGKNFHV